jgi:thiamine-monophosphate kinase
MAEFELIARHFAPLAAVAPGALGLKDDAALLSVPPGHELVVTKDMIAQGVHYYPEDPAATVGAKLAAVNISDLAAMGAQPLACFLGLGLPSDWPETWVADFARGLGDVCARYGCPLMGGDTINGVAEPILSLTALGVVPLGQALRRGGAQLRDDVYVSGQVGEAGLALQALEGFLDDPRKADWVERYRRPVPRLALGQALRGVASACADVSDGLFADARNIALASQVGIDIELKAVPCPNGTDPIAAGTAGDDYELVFSAPPSQRETIFTLSQSLGLSLTRIGLVTAEPGLRVLDRGGKPIKLAQLGYIHR